jgi:hypothetical protein
MARKEKSQTAKAIDAVKTAVEAKKAPKPIFTPTQVIEQITEKMSRENAILTKSELTGALMDFADEANSRISIGLHFLKLQIPLGSDFTATLEKFAYAVNRSMAALWQYIGLAKVASFEFQKNPTARAELFRIWDAKGCYDPANGELKPVVAETLKLHPIPESKDGAECAVWARKFVNEVNNKVRATRKAQSGKVWDAATVDKRSGALVKSARQFATKANGRAVRKMLLDMFVAMATIEGEKPSVIFAIVGDALNDARNQMVGVGLEKRKAEAAQAGEAPARLAS